jgi:hypothetical protein
MSFIEFLRSAGNIAEISSRLDKESDYKLIKQRAMELNNQFLLLLYLFTCTQRYLQVDFLASLNLCNQLSRTNMHFMPSLHVLF